MSQKLILLGGAFRFDTMEYTQNHMENSYLTTNLNRNWRKYKIIDKRQKYYKNINDQISRYSNVLSKKPSVQIYSEFDSDSKSCGIFNLSFKMAEI